MPVGTHHILQCHWQRLVPMILMGTSDTGFGLAEPENIGTALNYIDNKIWHYHTLAQQADDL
jgi:hypothetical protein